MSQPHWYWEGKCVTVRKTGEDQWQRWFDRYESERGTTVAEILTNPASGAPFVSRRHFYTMYARYVEWRERMLSDEGDEHA